jgi:nitroreductase
MMITEDDLFTELFNRKSIRKFKDKKIPDEVVNKIIKMGQNAPTGGGTQVYSFVWISDEELKDKIIRILGKQQFMIEAPLWIMLCIDWARQYELFQHLNIEVDLGEMTKLWRGMMDVMLAAENMVIAAEGMGLGSCFNGGIRMHMDELSDLLKLPKNVLPVLLICIGYPNEKPPPRPRWPLEAVLHKNRYTMPSSDIINSYYESANKSLKEMNYFSGDINSWKEHWKRRFNKRATETLEKRLRNQLNYLGFSH